MQALRKQLVEISDGHLQHLGVAANDNSSAAAKPSELTRPGNAVAMLAAALSLAALMVLYVAVIVP